MFKNQFERLVLLLVLEIENKSEWGAPSFGQHKPKVNRVSFMSECRNLNKQLKRRPHPMPNINKILLKLEGFQYAVSLVLSMGYYHI